MDVTVEQAGQEVHARDVDRLVPIQTRADGDEAAVLDHHVRLRRSGARPVEYLGPGEERSGHGGPFAQEQPLVLPQLEHT